VTSPGDPLRPTALEIAAGDAVGRVAGLEDLPAPRDETPLEALEAIVAPALEAGPCLVAFSGGRDSSAVLAAAASAARRRGLPLPVPLTQRFPGLAESDESAWQERVLAHLRLPDWERVEIGEGELDTIGPHAQRCLRRHGVLYPANGYIQLPLLERARGGTLVTGNGGDQLFLLWRWASLGRALGRRRRPRPRDPLSLALAAAPSRVRRAVDARRTGDAPPWLRSPHAEEYEARLAEQRSSQPRAWSGYPAWLRSLRMTALTVHTHDLLAADAGARALSPFTEPRFLAAVGRAGGRLGLGSRAEGMRALFGSVLPPDVLARSTKAFFNEATWTQATRAFAAEWDGSGVNPELVDPGELRSAWSGRPQIRPMMLLQQAWLATDGA
jgi:asparagine synthase (glutamine-hydrolysing)